MNSAIDRLTRARIQIQMKNPFFSYMSLYLKFKNSEECETMGVDKNGNLYYNDKFVNGLNDNELQGVLIHEIMHLVLLHLTRKGSREHQLFNVATDLCINYLVEKNGFTLPEGALIPDNDGVFNYQNIRVEEIDKKQAEEVYDDLLQQLKEKEGDGEGEGNGKGKGTKSKDLADKGFDEHHYAEGMTDKEKKEVESGWLDKIHEGMSMAKMRGDIPAGMERLVGDLHKEKINWRSLLNNYITQQIPYNSCYSKPHKRSISVGSYVPHQLKEKIEISVCVDLSGSVGQKEYADFMSEIVGIARAYQERIDIHFYSHDTEGYYGGLVRNGNIEKIKNISLKGNGGTSHKAVMDMMNDGKSKMVVFFTDGYSDLNEIEFHKYNYDKVFVIVNGTDEQVKNKNCKTIKFDEVND